MKSRVTQTPSIFTSIHGYFVDLGQRLSSLWTALSSALPYLLSSGELRREVTERYSDPISSKTIDDLPPRSRGLLFNDIKKCTGCKECEKICPTECIEVETELGKDENTLWVSTFDIDFSKCVFCGLCTEVCLPLSLVHTKRYEASVENPSEFIAHFGRGLVTEDLRKQWTNISENNDEDRRR